jgi:NADH-quinone oxidoreductase subunit L
MNQLNTILTQSISLFVFLPLVGFLALLFLQNREEKIVSRIVLFTKVIYIISAVGFAVAWVFNGAEPLHVKLGTIYQADHFVFAIQFYYDKVTAVFSVVGSLIFFLVATFSRYYMHRDEGFKRFFHIILLFAAGYNLITFAGNFETLFIGWEVKGLCSFLLIAFYRNRYLPVKNAFKTISYYRISDLALILAMWMMHHLTHQNIAFTQLREAGVLAEKTGHHMMAVFIVSMLALAAIVKSAQFPFTSWLPRAMEGPTSSSAIFYGSLSVHVGVFLLLRTWPFWQDMEWVKILIIVIGAVTGIVATLIARVQPTVKTQIAYSSAAQIGIIFIEIALGFHVLALVHFAGNAFLRTYQLLVSPSVLNYLVHHQYFHYHPPEEKQVSGTKATFYILGVKEWNMDTFMFRFVWNPFKWIGSQLQFLNTISGNIVLAGIAIVTLVLSLRFAEWTREMGELFPIVCLLLALLTILTSFASRRSARRTWDMILIAHVFILSAITSLMNKLNYTEIVMYGAGVLVAYILGRVCLQRTHAIDKDTQLDQYHGYVYEGKQTALFFLLSAVGLLGFPITSAFIGIDVFFTYIPSAAPLLITLMALCFIFIELAAIRIYLRIYCGPHKKLDHPVAFRSS